MAIRVLHCIGSLNRGGAQRQLQLLLAHIDQERFASGALFLEASVYGDADDPLPRFEPYAELLPVERGGRWDLAGLRRRIDNAIRRFEPDVVHAWLPEVVTIPAALTARRLRRPLVSSYRRSVRGLRDRAAYLPHALGAVVVSNFDLSGEPPIARLLFRRRRGRVIRNAIDVASVTSAEAPALPPPRADCRLLTVGRLAPTKRVDLAIRAVAELRRRGVDAELLVCGRGSARAEAELEALVAELGLADAVRFLGFRPDWPGIARQTDLLLQPSVSEGMSNVVVEAAAVGLPVVAARVDGLREVFTHGEDAWLAAPGDLGELVAAVETLHRAPELRRRLAAKAEAIVGAFSAERLAAEYEELYTGLVEED